MNILTASRCILLFAHPVPFSPCDCMYATDGIAVGILSVRLFVRPSDACIVTKLNDALRIFLYHTKGQSLCYSDTNSG